MRRFARKAVLPILLIGTTLLGGCYVVPYGPRYAYGPGPYYHPYYYYR